MLYTLCVYFTVCFSHCREVIYEISLRPWYHQVCTNQFYIMHIWYGLYPRMDGITPQEPAAVSIAVHCLSDHLTHQLT